MCNGAIDGDCVGKANGTYDGNGKMARTMAGACDPFFVKIPATEEFVGTVDESTKIVNLNVTGKGGGIERSDVLNLNWEQPKSLASTYSFYSRKDTNLSKLTVIGFFNHANIF